MSCTIKSKINMNASQFVKQLEESAPSMFNLMSIGLSEKAAEDFRRGYFCQARDKVRTIESNEIIDLSTRWDVSNIEIGMVRLSGECLDDGHLVQVGVVEVDPLVIDKNTSAVMVVEFQEPWHVLWKAATNAGGFLDVLIAAANYFSNRTVGIVDFDDTKGAYLVARECARLAGGEECLPFYLMLLGAE